MLCALMLFAATSLASAETRVLKFYNLHTKERAEIAYKRDGRYLKSGLDKINYILRDWRKNEEIKINPRLLDLVWQVYQITGSKEYINVICGYRTTETNTMLRKRSSGVAKKSQHTLGNALDFFLPDVKLSTLRKVALKLQAGGVGYYPRSGSPFVHIDVGNVRHWPRMDRQQLLALFPDGKTLHIPADGKPLPGYQQALAAYEKRQRNGGSIMVAEDSSKRSGGLLAALFGGGADEEEDTAEAAAAPPRVAQSSKTNVPAPQTTESQPEPERPEAPATVLASLPAGAVPVPHAAPRPEIGVGESLPEKPFVPPVAVASTEPGKPANGDAAAKGEEKAAVALAALDVPVPTRRPDYSPVLPTPKPERVAAADSESSPEDAEDAPTLAAISSDAPESAASDAIAEILAKETARMNASRQVAMLPLPSARPEPQKASLDAASIPAPVPASMAIVRPAAPASDASAVDLGVPTKRAHPVSDTPRLALLRQESGAPSAAVIAGGVKTTPKDAKPRRGEAPLEPKAVVLPVKASGVSERVLSNNSLRMDAAGTKPPAFDLRLVHSPDVVYMAGFRHNDTTLQDQHFTGQAVTFLAVARFATN